MGAGFGDDAAEVGDTCGYGGEGDEAGVALRGDDPGEGGLATAGWAPDDDRRELAGLDQAAEQLAGTDEVLLADVVIEVSGSHAGGERRAGGIVVEGEGVGGEEGLLGLGTPGRAVGGRHA
jgi:hypothetical protein